MKRLPANASRLAQYEAAKGALQAKSLTSKEYEAEIKKLIKKLKI